jgi:hypothetical protein
VHSMVPLADNFEGTGLEDSGSTKKTNDRAA